MLHVRVFPVFAVDGFESPRALDGTQGKLLKAWILGVPVGSYQWTAGEPRD